MALVATSPSESYPSRDLASEAQVYVHQMITNINGASALCPLDTPEKTDQASSFFDGFYEIIAFTTLDIDHENAIINHPDIIKLMPDIRRVMGECEGALEVTWAERVAATRDSVEAWKVFNTTPIHEFYEHVLKTEWAALESVMGRAPKSVAILGSGAMPETGIFITEWAKKNNKRIQIHSLEISAERLEKSQKVYDILCGSSEHLTFEVGDIKTAPQDLGAYEVVYFNAAVGATTTEKEDLIINVVKRMKPGAFVLSRTTHSLKTMAYPPAQIQTPRIVKKLRPVLTGQMNGEAGKSANASYKISRVL